MSFTQTSLFDINTHIATRPAFDGADYRPERDYERLTGQLKRVYEAISDGRWRSLGEPEAITGDPQASISAQLRHLRKQRFGSHAIEKRYLGDGLYKYRLVK